MAEDYLSSDEGEILQRWEQIEEDEFGPLEGEGTTLIDQAQRDDLENAFNFKAFQLQQDQQRWDENNALVEKGEAWAGEAEAQIQNVQSYFDDIYECTVNGTCADESQNILNNTGSEWRYDNLDYNRPLIESLYRTYGAFDKEGKQRTPKQLIDQFMHDGAIRLVNITELGADAAGLDNMTEQQKQDFALQMLSYDKVRATGEGSRDLGTQTTEIVKGIITDPTNFLFAGGGAGVAAKTTLGTLGKKGIKDWATNFLKHRHTQTALKSGTIGGIYTGADEALRQIVKMEGGIQDEADWGKLGAMTGFGFLGGSALGLFLSGGSEAFVNTMNKWMIDNNLTNKDALKVLRDNVQDEVGLSKWLKNLGWSRKEVEQEVQFLREGGFTYDKEKKAWVNPEGMAHKPRMEVRKGEEYHFKGNKDVKGTMAPNELITNAQKVLDKEYAIQNNKELQIPFRKFGQNTFDYLNRTLNENINWIYGPDAILVRSGLRKFATGISDAMATANINTGRINRDLKGFIKKNVDGLGEDLNALWRNRANQESYNPVQKELITKLESYHKQQLRNAVRNKVISVDEYKKYIKDKMYVPRVWNTQHLITKKGSQEFSQFLSKLWKLDPSGTRKIIENITGDTKLTDEVIDKRFNLNNIANMFRNKADREMNIERSSHLEHERKIKIADKYENMLDQFMAPFEDRWAMYFDDVIKRNEFASRFGANDEKITSKIKELRKAGKGREADNLQESYFSTVRDPRAKSVGDAMRNSALSRGVSKINAFQTVNKLGLAAIPNATQSFVNGITTMVGSGAGPRSFITAPARAVISMIKGMGAITPKRLDVIHKAGLMGEIDIAKIANENAMQSRIINKEFKGPLAILNEPTKFLKATGFIPVEIWNRRSAGIMAHAHIQDLHAQLQRLMLKGKGMTPKAVKIEKQLKGLGVNSGRDKEISANDLAIGIYNMNKDVNFSGESFNLPTKWHGPYGKLFTKFKSFMFYQSRFVKRKILDPLIDDKNIAPAVAYLTAAGIAGNLAGDARNWMTGREEDDAHNRELLAWVIRGLQNAGGTGLFFETMKKTAESGPDVASDLLGPTVSDAAYLGKDLLNLDLKKFAERLLVPNIPFKAQIEELISY